MWKMYAPQQVAKTFVAPNLARARIGGKVENRLAALVVQIAVGPTKARSIHQLTIGIDSAPGRAALEVGCRSDRARGSG